MTDNATPGLWTAIIADGPIGKVYPTLTAAAEDLNPDAEAVIAIVRDTAAPIHRDGELCRPEECRPADIAHEENAYLADDDNPELSAAIRYAQAQRMAAGLNADASNAA